MQLKTHWITAADGVRLFVREFTPDASLPKRTLVWTHGIGEHGGRYDHVIERLTADGWRVLLGDLRGHGLSEGPRTYVRSFEDYVTDVEQIWREFGCDASRTALLGNSMGGLIAIRTLQISRRVQPRVVVLLSPLLGVGVRVPKWLVRLGRVLVPILPQARFRSRINPENMTHHPTFQQKRREDPLLQHSVTGGWYFAMRRALRAAHAEACRVDLPLLVMQGTGDQTVQPEQVAIWARETCSADQQVVYLHGQFHELLHECQWQETLAFLQRWLDDRVP